MTPEEAKALTVAQKADIVAALKNYLDNFSQHLAGTRFKAVGIQVQLRANGTFDINLVELDTGLSNPGVYNPTVLR